MPKATKVGSGTLYPMLARLEAAGWLTSEWEVVDPSEEAVHGGGSTSLPRSGRTARA
jgi:hypothetical protein